jgi:CIC family chloride channel protein
MSAMRRSTLLLAAAIGVVTGFAVLGFERLVVDVGVDHVLDAPLVVLAILPGIGLVLAELARRVIGGGVSPATSDAYLLAYHDGVPLGWRAFAGRITASIATLGTGGAMGLEGPSLYIGSTFADRAARRVDSTPNRRGQALLAAGAAAGVAAIFKAPATGAVFALEVPYQDDFGRRALAPSLVAAACGYLAFASVDGTSPLFPVHSSLPIDFADIASAILLGLVCGALARGFAWLLVVAKHWSEQQRTQVRLVVATAGSALAFVVARVATGESLTIGPGYNVLQWVSLQNTVGVIIVILLVRALATTSTVAGGGSGGLFIPLVLLGALTGRAVGVGLHRDAAGFTVLGVAAFLGAGYRVPLAALMFVAETTGKPGFVVPALLATTAADLIMGNSSVTTYQRRTTPLH